MIIMGMIWEIAIKAIVSAIEQSVPKDGIVLRYGGDEFVVLIPILMMKK